MKEYKNCVTSELNNGFNEISNLLNVFKLYIEMQHVKQKDEVVDEFFITQMRSLEAQAILQFRKVTDSLIRTRSEWRNKNKEDET